MGGLPASELETFRSRAPDTQQVPYPRAQNYGEFSKFPPRSLRWLRGGLSHQVRAATQAAAKGRASAVAAVRRARRAARKLRAAREAVMRMADLKDDNGMVNSLKAEVAAKAVYDNVHRHAVQSLSQARRSERTARKWQRTLHRAVARR